MPESRAVSKHALYIESLKSDKIRFEDRYIEMPDPYENVPILELSKQYDPTDEQWKEHLKNFLRNRGLLND